MIFEELGFLEEIWDVFESTNKFLPDDRVALKELAYVRDNLLSRLYFLYVTCWLLSAHLKPRHWKIRLKISINVPFLYICMLIICLQWTRESFLLCWCLKKSVNIVLWHCQHKENTRLHYSPFCQRVWPSDLFQRIFYLLYKTMAIQCQAMFRSCE